MVCANPRARYDREFRELLLSAVDMIPDNAVVLFGTLIIPKKDLLLKREDPDKENQSCP